MDLLEGQDHESKNGTGLGLGTLHSCVIFSVMTACGRLRLSITFLALTEYKYIESYRQSRVLCKRGPVMKIFEALPCLNTVAQLPDCLCTRSCHHRHVSMPVLPQAGKNFIYFETNLSAVFRNPEHWKSDRIGCVNVY